MQRIALPVRLAGGALALSIAFLACATEDVPGAKYDPLERFPETALWVWDPAGNVLPEGDRFADLDLGPLLDETVTDVLAARGYRKGSDAAHYRVSYQLGITTRLRPEESVAVGSLSLLLREARTKRPVWLGFARAEIDVNRSAEERRARLREIVEAMLADFPPGLGD